MSLLLPLSYTALNGAYAKGSHAPTAETVNKETKIAIKKILDDPGSFENKDVTVQGINKGWSGACASSKMLTRSDWIVEDETGCIYVTGVLTPTGSPADKPQGERVVVQGKVMIGVTGKPVIQADKLTPVP
jgi:hypothetical protein